MSDNNIKAVYTQDEVKAMMRACLKGINETNRLEPAINASNRLAPALYIDEDDGIYKIIYDIQDMFSQILRILNAEYNEICEVVEAAEREANDESMDGR